MKMCAKHWELLRKAVEENNLDQFVSSDGNTAMSNMQTQLDGEDVIPDPLMHANWMITTKALEMGGMYLMSQDEFGNEYCPVCEAAKYNQGKPDENGEIWDYAMVEKHWTEDVVIAIREMFIEKGWLKPQ